MYFRENWLKFLGIWGAAELFWGFREHKQNTFRELRQKLTGIWGDQSIIFRELGSKDPPPGGASLCKYHITSKTVVIFHVIIVIKLIPLV